MAETSEANRVGNFIIPWIRACALGYAIGMPSGSFVAETLGYPLWHTIVAVMGISPDMRQYDYVFASALMGAISGGIVSFGQWVVLRRYMQNAFWWIWIGLVCNLVGILLNSLWPESFKFSYFAPTIFTASIMGYLEWLVLRKSLPVSGWIPTRIAINSVALIVANINAAYYPTFLLDRLVNNTLMGLISGLVAGVVSGLLLNSVVGGMYQTLRSDL